MGSKIKVKTSTLRFCVLIPKKLYVCYAAYQNLRQHKKKYTLKLFFCAHFNNKICQGSMHWKLVLGYGSPERSICCGFYYLEGTSKKLSIFAVVNRTFNAKIEGITERKALIRHFICCCSCLKRHFKKRFHE